MFSSGIGYDVHQLVEGRPLVLGGVTMEYPRGLDGHSDADVLCHAIADAILGAAGLADIGHYFPNTDESIRGIDSLEILRRVREIVAKEGATLFNVDSTLISEAPKIAPHLSAMKQNIATALDLPVSRVGIKATTNETMGFLGRGEGIAAMAVAALDRP